MPQTEVIIFADGDNSSPLLRWLDRQPHKVQDKCIVQIERLAQLGYELRRPAADYLRDAIYELRFRYGNVNYRMLYFFHDKIVIISHGFTKEDKVPDVEIERAIRNKMMFEANPNEHSYKE